MNSYLVSESPIIYADMNVYRYLACGDISIYRPERFIWVYSHVHLDEIHRNGNTDALEGMKLLQALEISDVLNEEFQSVGNIVLHNYIDPYERYQRHLDAIAGFTGSAGIFDELLIHLFGAGNFQELTETPDKIREAVERITSTIDDGLRHEIFEKASIVSSSMKVFIEANFKERKPIDKTRKALGIKSEARKNIEKSSSAIDEVWDLISPSISNVTKNQFFGFEAIPGVESVQQTQHGAISGAHLVLNMIGISPDRGLANREKIQNIMSDGLHIGMASYCNAFVSADKAMVNKAMCIYSYLKSITNALHFEYKKGYELNLGVKITKNNKDKS